MNFNKLSFLLCAILLLAVFSSPCRAYGAEQPVAIFHAFDQSYRDVETFVCDLAEQGYSHVQIAPAQQSNPSPAWWARYQPVDYSVIEGRGSEDDLRTLVAKAHSYHVKVIADVVFNHMANMAEYRALNFPHLSPQDFHPPCDINYSDRNRDSEINCWLGVCLISTKARTTCRTFTAPISKSCSTWGLMASDWIRQSICQPTK